MSHKITIVPIHVIFPQKIIQAEVENVLLHHRLKIYQEITVKNLSIEILIHEKG